MSIISVKDLTYSYNKQGTHKVIDGLNIELDSRDITLLTGKSGCGKSTLLYLLSGIYPENGGFVLGGDISCDGKSIDGLKPYQQVRLTSMMFQNPDLQFCMDTVKNEIIFALENKAVPREEMDGAVDRALSFCGISDLKDRAVVTLSGGEKQKVVLACIVALAPRWILLDEPFANIDEATAAVLVQKLEQLHRETGMGIIAVDHHPYLWDRIVTKTFEMKEGRVLETDCVPERIPYPRVCRETEERETVLTLKNVSVRQSKKFSLGDFSGAFEKGKIYAVTGRSGSGKTTLLNGLNRIYKYNGSISLKGKELSHIPLRKMAGEMGFVFQNPQDQFVADTVYDEVALSFGNESEKEKAEATEAVLRKIDLWKYRLFSPYMLSQGQQRRLGVATLMACRGDVLICDEPTYAQDRENTVAIMEMLCRETREKNITLIFTTHDMALARNYSDVLLELREGGLYEIN